MHKGDNDDADYNNNNNNNNNGLQSILLFLGRLVNTFCINKPCIKIPFSLVYIQRCLNVYLDLDL